MASSLEIVIGVAGEIGAGKDTLCELFAEELRASHVNISDFARCAASAEGVSLDRESLTAFSRRKIMNDGPNVFLRAAIDEIYRAERKSAVVSGVRTPENVAELRSEFGDKFFLVGVEIRDYKIRYARIRSRQRGSALRTDSDLLENDRIQDRDFRIGETMKLCDSILDNSTSLSDLGNAARELASSLAQR